MKALILFVCWCILLVLCWPLALLALLIGPLILVAWVVVGLVFLCARALYALLESLLFLPARLLGHRGPRQW